MTQVAWKPSFKPARTTVVEGPAIVGLELDPQVRRPWMTDGMTLHVPVPPGERTELTQGRALVWGRFGPDRRLPLVADGDAGLETAYPWADWRSYILSERYATTRRRPLHTRSPISYKVVPDRIRYVLARRMCRARAKQATAFPAAPFDGGFEALRSVVRGELTSDAPDPAPRICLTHDIDVPNFQFVKQIAHVESALGLRSCWNVVPFGYRVNYRVCDWLIENGFEIGLHGYCHDNRLIYLSESRLRRRLDACRGFVERYAVCGFRSPSWFRNARLMRVLADYVKYDCSCLDFDWLCPAGRGGVLTATPFRFGRLIEIPTTLPFEAPLLVGTDPADTVAYWRPKIDWLVQVHGQAVINAHPDPHYSGNGPMIAAYRQLLEELLAAYGDRWSLPRDLAEEVVANARCGL
ncbi:MAG: hypothetical protein JSV19_07510 [Phycisphaerales bacterium]|nr:MAG: hypothetical protein JSV19_07510 [Phycisphaerales bacterium]